MASLRDIRRKIASVKNTQQITKAMKMVAAAKLRRAQDRIGQIRPYAEALSEMLSNVASKVEPGLNEFLAEKGDKRICYVVISADRGFCGSFNANVIKSAEVAIERDRAAGKEVHLITAGKKVFDHFRRRGFEIDFDLIGFFNSLQFEHALALANRAAYGFSNGEYDQVHLIYTHAESPAKQHVVTDQLLPIKPAETEESNFNYDYIFEPSANEILNELCPKTVNISIWKALAISYFGEEGARMIAMDNATENAQEMINGLTLTYNKARQAAITTEILEIVGGAEALK